MDVFSRKMPDSLTSRSFKSNWLERSNIVLDESLPAALESTTHRLFKPKVC